MLKKLAALTLALAFFVLQSQSALACGGLVAPNGAVRLARATTLVAWHDGIERYMTSFTYQGDISKVGWIVPLPAVPLKIEKGGAWTLQRLARETRPQVEDVAFGAVRTAASVAVLQQVVIDALDITVLKGSGQQILDWASSNGFFVNQDTRDHLLAYAGGSPIFMAAKFDTAQAKNRGQLQGDGTPVLITMKTAHIWVPFEVLALDDQQVQADLYLLTDLPVTISDIDARVGQSPVGQQVPGAPGLTVSFQEQMNDTLYHDLSTDRNMSWVRHDSWLTYLNLDAPYSAVTYDLGVSNEGVVRIAPFGTPPMAVVDGQKSRELPSWLPRFPMGTFQGGVTVAVLLGILLLILLVRRVSVRYFRNSQQGPGQKVL